MIGLFANHAQRRLAADRLCVAVAGMELAGSISENTWIDPITQTLMLRPNPLHPDWYTSDSGAFSKLGLTDFAAPGPEWEQRQDQHWAGPWLAVKDSTLNPALVSQSSVPANVGISFAWFSYGGGGTFLQARLGWGGDPTGESGVVLDLYTDGHVDVWRDGARIAQGRISGSRSPLVRRLQVFELLAIPIRESELLIISKAGDGFVVPIGDSAGAITPSGPIWFQCPNGATQVQIAPVRYPSQGFATSLETALLEPPMTGETPVTFENPAWAGGAAGYRIYGWAGGSPSTATASALLTEWDGATPFVPNGEDNEVRIRIEFETGDDRFTPFIAGAQIAYDAIAALTDGSTPTEMTPRILAATLSVPADLGTAVVDVSLRHDEAARGEVDLEGGGIPIRLDLDSAPVLDGWGDPCDEIAGGMRANRTELTVRDRWSALESAVFADRMPLDGLTVSQAIAAIVAKSGINPSRMVISDSDTQIPDTGIRPGVWSMLVESGDGAADWLIRLVRTFTPTWFVGFRPASDGSGEEFFALAPDDLPSVPAAVIYPSRMAAISDGVAAGVAWKFVARRITRATLAPAANEVRVVGLDPAHDRPRVAVRTNTAAQTVDLPVESRGPGWSGSIRRFELVDAGLTDQSAIDAACEALFAEKCRPRTLVEFECQLLQNPSGAPLWRGDLVEIHGHGQARLVALSAHFEFEVPGGTHRPALYVAELLSEGGEG